jgi:lysyl-tRNA synthetase class 2
MRRVAAAPLLISLALASTGWLYVVRPGLPGPRIGNALPLDELSKQDAAPLLWFALIWLAAGLLLGAYARWARIERLRAAALFGLGVAVVMYLADTASISIVQQIAAHQAFDQAIELKAVYVAGGLVALGVAALARGGERRSATIVAVVVGLAGMLNLVYTLLPGREYGLIHSLTPGTLWPLARASLALTGVALLLAARGLARRRQRAWQLALVVSTLSTVLHVLHGLDHGTLASTVVLALLVATRDRFDGPGDEATRLLPLRRAAVVATTICVYALIALWLNRWALDRSFSLRFVADEVLHSVTGAHVRGSPHLAGGFSDWFPLSLFLMALVGTAWVLLGWLAPWRHRVRQEAPERELARSLVQAWGSDTIAPFVLRGDKSYFFGEGQRAFLAYRVVGGVAVVSGDPIGPPDEIPALVARFVEHARRADWRIAILGASCRLLDLYRSHGLQALYHGDEAVVDTAAFSLEGRAIRKVRQSVHRLEHAGYRAKVLKPSEVHDALRHRLVQLTEGWRGDQPERGFVMALDALFSLGDEDALFVVGFAPDGRADGFLHFAVAPAASALSLSSMPRSESAPNGFNEWLISETIAWAREHGFRRVSLNFAPFAALLAPEAELSGMQEVQRRALLTLKGHFQLDNLLLFNRKFFPEWERRFVVYERRRDLPRVGLAALAAEAYLPFQSARR